MDSVKCVNIFVINLQSDFGCRFIRSMLSANDA